MVIVLVLIVVIVVVGFFLMTVYNKLVKFRERVRNAFAQIDVQLERRHDLIPNLVEVAKGYMSHERETLEAVVAARASATQARIEVSGDPENLQAMQKMAQSEGALGASLGRLLAVAEAYPDLKANQNMMQLTEELTTTENKIAYSRQNYNDQVNGYQTYKASFPPVLLANMFGFSDSAYLNLEDEGKEHKRENIEVSFDDNPPQDSGA
ncbi:MAG: LemA family protein [Actinomycetia bacterium]|nr:LemA family protein [Actinomycetes bacterium]MCP4958231.1 LemA family protein [Actinomycetes bacterium]